MVGRVHPGPIAPDLGVAAAIKDGAYPSLGAEDIITVLEAGDFHWFLSPWTKHIEAAYSSFTDNVVRADLS